MSSGKKAGNDATSAAQAGTEPTATSTDDVDELQQLFVLYDHDGASEVIS